jgi:hypothetical protein
MYKIILVFLGCCMVLFLSGSVSAQVLINEVGWMGTNISAADEWIELYNNSSSTVDLTGWKLSAADGTPAISLSGSLPASGFGLLERTDDSTVPGVPALVIYTGALSNSGETLVLKDGQGVVIDTVDGSGGWPGGSSTTFETMQRIGGAWSTGASTPGTANIEAVTSSENQNTESPSGQSGESEHESEEKTETHVGHIEKPSYFLRMLVPDGTLSVGMRLQFKGSVTRSDKTTIETGRIVWSFGDGTSIDQSKPDPILHTYKEAGTYVVVLQFFETPFDNVPTALERKEITVISSDIILSIEEKGYRLTNKTGRDVNLAGWEITDWKSGFVFPQYTYIKADASLLVSYQTAGFRSEYAKLYTPDGEVVRRDPDEDVSKTQASPYSQTKTSSSVGNFSTLSPKAEASEIKGTMTSGKGSHKSPLIWIFVGFLAITSGAFLWYTLSRKGYAEKSPEKDSDGGLEDILFYDE